MWITLPTYIILVDHTPYLYCIGGSHSWWMKFPKFNWWITLPRLKVFGLGYLFLPVAWIDQSMQVGQLHGLFNPCKWEKKSYYDPAKDWKIQRPFLLTLYYGRGGSDYPLSHIYCCHLDGDKDNWRKTWWQYSFGVSWSLDKAYFDILI